MGSITRSIANNITTGGVFTSSAIANTSVTGITTLANVSDGITFISSQTASNSATLSFTSGLDSTYKAYKFVFSSIHPRTDTTQFQFNMSTDSGSNYNVTKTSTFFHAFQNESGSSTGLTYVTDGDLAQSTSFQIISVEAGGLGNGADESCSGSLIIFNPASTVYVKHFIGNTNSYNADNYSLNVFTAGYGNTLSAVDSVQFKMSTGNFDGTIALYGIK